VHTTKREEEVVRQRRRKHPDEFKASVVAECARPGVSIARVALSHGLNANLVHRWRRLADGRERGRQAVRRIEEFVAVPMASVHGTPPPEEIRIEVRRGSLVVSVSWPMSAAAHSATWLRELLR
jgi:transposase